MIDLPKWNALAEWAALFSFILSVLIMLLYGSCLWFLSSANRKYNFIAKNEIPFLRVASICVIIGCIAYVNSELSHVSLVLIFVRSFISLSIALVLGFLFRYSLGVYYPQFIEKRLASLRTTPRISPKSGKPMKLLSEGEEDVHLAEGMKAEEDVFSVDYDVWLDEETGFKRIEKYPGRVHTLKCPQCNYQTYHLKREEILKPASQTANGELMKYFECTYCNHKGKKITSFKAA
jgi:hypothetical protein